MTTEERIDEYYRWVLGRLKVLLDTSPSNKPIQYELSHVVAAGVPSNDTEENIVRKLDELGAVKITGEFPRTWEYKHNGYFELSIQQPKFDELCKKFGVIEEKLSKNKESTTATKSKFIEIEDLPKDTLPAIWWLFKRIKKEYLATSDGEDVLLKFVPGEVVFAGKERTVPDLEDQKLSLKLLQRLGVVKTKSDYFTPRKDNNFFIRKGQLPDGHYLDILQPRFDETYKRCEKLCEEDDEPKPASEPKHLDKSNLINIPIKIVVSDINSIYSEIEAEKNEVQFYIKVANYGKYILENQATNDLLKTLYSESKKDIKAYIIASEKFLLEWKTYAEDILEQAKTAGIEDDPKDPLDNDAERIRIGLTNTKNRSFWDFDLDYLFTPYLYLVRKFNKIGKSELLVPKHIKSIEDLDLNLFTSYQAANIEWNKFKYIRESSVWWAHFQICKAAVGILDLRQKQDYFDDGNDVDEFYKYEFGQLTKGNLRNPIVLHQAKYRIWIKRLHNYLIPRLNQEPKENEKIDSVSLKKIIESIVGDRKDNFKFPYKLPAGTTWGNVTIKFLNNEDVFIQVQHLKHNTNYKEMGLVGKGKNPNPSEAWTFLKVLAEQGGELSINDPNARDKYKKQKEILAKTLKNYFLIEYDPFWPYRSSPEKNGNSYKIKMTLIPPDKVTDSVS